MESNKSPLRVRFGQLLTRLGIGLRMKLILIFLAVQVLPLILLTLIAWQQINTIGDVLREIAVEDASEALNASAVENIERMSTDAAQRVAAFLYERDDDILYLAGLEPTLENYRRFGEGQTGAVVDRGSWQLAEDGSVWEQLDPPEPATGGGISTNVENNDMDGFHYRQPETYTSTRLPYYDEITFVGLDGVELVKYVSPDSPKTHYPMSTAKMDVSQPENTYIKAENYFEKLQDMQPGEIYVSDVIGAYVGSNYIGMYTPERVATAAEERGYDIEYAPEAQAYAGRENPEGQRFEGIVRWATPVADESGAVVGYVTFALNHDHIMEFVDHLTPMNERYTQLPSAFEGNYAFIWDYNCRSICHPRHHSIVGYNPETGEEQIPWLEASIYDGWQASDIERWTDYVADYPTFYEQSREKKPAAQLTQAGFVGLDGRYLNNAPQCIGWMDLTGEGGSGSFYILWSGIYKLNTAAAIPYYTGQYAPGAHNDYSKRGFGFVAIGSGLEDFTRPATDMEGRLIEAIGESKADTNSKLLFATVALIVLVVLIAVWVASSITGKLTKLIAGISRFSSGERQFRFGEPVKDEFGALADSFDDMADSIVDSVKNPLSITDMDRTVLYMNEPGLDFCRRTLDEVVGTSYKLTSIYPSGSEYDPILALEEGREAEIYYLESSDRYLRGMANYLQNKNGKNVGYLIETADVTDMVREQRRIEEQKSLLDKVFAASPDLIWYMDAQGAYYTVNPRFAAIANRPPEEFVGRTAEEILPEDIARGFAVNDIEAIEASKPLYSEERMRFADGHEEILDSVRTPIYDPNGGLIGLLGFARDVTVRVNIEDELRETQQELENAVLEANRANAHKGDFLARMSHEIRTPMNAIIGLTNIVQRKLGEMAGGDDVELVEKHVDQIEASSQHLLGLLNDILDLSKIEAGHIELSDETVELAKLADTVAGIIRPRCEEKNIRFDTRFEVTEPSSFRLDSLRLRQVLINLLGNAVKFTPECGSIEFNIVEKQRAGGKALVEFVVKDTGIGIEAENIGAIFESFEQGGSDVARKHGGTGLGLAISKRIVQLFGSEIDVESTVGEGSCFHFELWLDEAAAGHAEDALLDTNVQGQFSGRRMLLVDDVDINRVIVVSMLEDTGITIDEAVDGRQALEMFEASAPGHYDIILMDVQMPVMNGYDATDAIRGLPRPDAQTVPIIAQTANAFKEDIDKAASHGMVGHIAKPVETDTLMALLRRYLRRRRDG